MPAMRKAALIILLGERGPRMFTLIARISFAYSGFLADMRGAYRSGRRWDEPSNSHWGTTGDHLYSLEPSYHQMQHQWDNDHDEKHMQEDEYVPISNHGWKSLPIKA